MPEKVAAMHEAVAQWAALHPVAGQHVEIAPNPGWRPPLDWADAVIPASELQKESRDGFRPGTLEVLEAAYRGRGKVVYE